MVDEEEKKREALIGGGRGLQFALHQVVATSPGMAILRWRPPPRGGYLKIGGENDPWPLATIPSHFSFFSSVFALFCTEQQKI